METLIQQPEIMAPVGSYESLHAAINAGADSVYFGIEQLNMRARAANNFTTEDLKKIVAICQENSVRTYLTLNTILYDHDMNLMKKICDVAKSSGLTAIICSDISAIQYANSIDLEVHLSTQMNITNVGEVKFYSAFADVMVMARELTLQQIAHIVAEVKKQDIRGPKGELVEIEIFIHGALCVAVSGKCYMSIATENSSANRGACLQNCRKSYKVTDNETGESLVLENEYIMSPSDLCTISFIDKILDAGVRVLKIEGRGRAPEYVDTVVRSYKEMITDWQKGEFTTEKGMAKMKELEKVFNRGFWQGGYYLGKKLGEWSGVYGSKATEEKVFLGNVEHYYNNPMVAQIKLATNEVCVGDEVSFNGKTTGVVRQKIGELFVHVDDVATKVDFAKKGDLITKKVGKRVHEKDLLYKIVPSKTKQVSLAEKN